MSEAPHIPALARWMDEHAIPDETLGAAYEALGDKGRATLKLCIARMHRIWGEPSQSERSDRRYAPDFRLISEESPAPYALVVCPAGYRSPAAFLAAVMPAVLAGVERVLPCFLDEENGAPPTPSLMAAMELAGVERCFHPPHRQILALLNLLCDKAPGGRIVLLGDFSCAGDLALAALSKGLSCRSYPQLPVFKCASTGLLMEQNFGQALPENRLAAPQPDAAEQDRLTLDEAHANVWLWPDLSPAWFRNRRLRLTS